MVAEPFFGFSMWWEYIVSPVLWGPPFVPRASKQFGRSVTFLGWWDCIISDHVCFTSLGPELWTGKTWIPPPCFRGTVVASARHWRLHMVSMKLWKTLFHIFPTNGMGYKQMMHFTFHIPYHVLHIHIIYLHFGLMLMGHVGKYTIHGMGHGFVDISRFQENPCAL